MGVRMPLNQGYSQATMARWVGHRLDEGATSLRYASQEPVGDERLAALIATARAAVEDAQHRCRELREAE